MITKEKLKIHKNSTLKFLQNIDLIEILKIKTKNKFTNYKIFLKITQKKKTKI